ncbi:unnamed protein product [Heterobilharzia americana]|nr:unnamed protein product [Heterobilharzia americana]
MTLLYYSLILPCIVQHAVVFAETNHNTTHNDIAVVKWEFHEFSTHINVMLFLFILVLLKLAYHHIPYISSYVPESLVLIIIGITFGAIVIYENEAQAGTIENTVWKFTPELFSYYLLPPIILESAYNLYNRTFSEYLGVVLLFSVLGTVFNFLIIGFLMYGLFCIGLLGYPVLYFDVKGFLLFSSLIVAVDPVAVLAIFQDIGVELSLYYIVFGESLFNDAITIVLYDIMVAFTGREEVTGKQIFIGVMSFFTVSLGGLLIGVLFGVLTCLITRIRSHLTVFTMLLLAYFSYIMADCVGWSGIISMIGCGLIQAAYAFHNIGEKYLKSVHLLTKMLAEVSEAVIFLFLGIQVISYKLEWHTGFIIWGTILCLLSRSIVIFSITAIVNYVNIDETKITLAQQIVLIYGGLRGAVAFALAVLISEDKFPINGQYHKNVIVTATLFIILFTVGFMGLTTKPLVRLLKIRKQDKQTLSLFNLLNKSIIDQTLTGIETLTDEKVVMLFVASLCVLMKKRYDEKILKVYEHIALKLLYASMHPRETESILKKIPEPLKFTHNPPPPPPHDSHRHHRHQEFNSLTGNPITSITQEWINRTNLYIVPFDDDHQQQSHNDYNVPREDSLISAGQMLSNCEAGRKYYSKLSLNTNETLSDHISHKNHSQGNINNPDNIDQYKPKGYFKQNSHDDYKGREKKQNSKLTKQESQLADQFTIEQNEKDTVHGTKKHKKREKINKTENEHSTTDLQQTPLHMLHSNTSQTSQVKDYRNHWLSELPKDF